MDRDFRDAIVESVAYCLVLNTHPLGRPSDTRKEFVQLSKLAATSASALVELRNHLDQMSPWSWDRLPRRLRTSGRTDAFSSAAHVKRLRNLAAVAKQLSDPLKGADKGGRPRYTAFNGLVSELANAFERATGERAAVSLDGSKEGDAQWGGRFLALVEAVLPNAVELARETGKPLAQPASKAARAEYVRDLCRRRCPVPRRERK